MSENNDSILLSLGEIKGSLINNTKVLQDLNIKQDQHAEKLSELVTNFEVFKTHSTICKNEFDNINSKLGRDYTTLNELKSKSLVENGVESYKGKKRDKWQWTLGIIGALIGVLIGLNQLAEIKDKIFVATPTSINSTYAGTIDNHNKFTMTRVDSNVTNEVKK